MSAAPSSPSSLSTSNEGPNLVSTDIIAMRDKFTKDAFVAMRLKFPSSDYTDDDLARFLIARNGDVTKASELFESHIQWKADPNNWPVYKLSCLEELKKKKVYMHGTDLEGHPLIIYSSRMNIASERDINEMSKMVLWWVEVILKEIPYDKSKITLLIDRSNFKQENSDIEFIRHIGKLFQVYIYTCNYEFSFLPPLN